MKDLDSLRRELTAIDDQLYRLFARRMAVVEEVAELKRQTGRPIYAPDREGAILNRVGSLLPKGLEGYGAALARTVLRLSRERQYELVSKHDQNWVLGKGVAEARVGTEGGEGEGPTLSEVEALELVASEGLFILGRITGDKPCLKLGKKLTLAPDAQLVGVLVPDGLEMESWALLVGVLADLALPITKLACLQGGELFVEFASPALERRAMRALYQLECELGGMRFVGWYPEYRA